MSELSQEIRLACMTCDRDDFDPTTIAAAVAADWLDIDEAVRLQESQWWTHLGVCIECRILAVEYAAAETDDERRQRGQEKAN